MKKGNFSVLKSASKLAGSVFSLVMLAGLISCDGGNDDPNSLKLEVKSEIGDLANYLTIENKEAVISLREYTEDGTPCIKIASTLQVNVNEAVASNYGFDLDVVILDKDLNELTDFGYYDIEDKSDYDNGDYNNYLPVGNYRAVMETSGEKSEWEGKASAMWDMMREKGKYIVLKPRWSSSKFVSYKGSASSSSSSEVSDEIVADDDVAEVSGGEDWDKILDEYETYCSQLAECAKKAKAGDVSAIAEYSSLLQSAESLQNKLNNASSNLSVAQAARLNKIAAKMANAMM